MGSSKKTAPRAPLPVLVTEKDLPRVFCIVAVGVTLALLLGLRVDAWFIGDATDTTFYYPYGPDVMGGREIRLYTCSSSCCAVRTQLHRVFPRRVQVASCAQSVERPWCVVVFGEHSSPTERLTALFAFLQARTFCMKCCGAATSPSTSSSLVSFSPSRFSWASRCVNCSMGKLSLRHGCGLLTRGSHLLR
jgi:hypothetical protein